jgi:hypothetical protein
MKADEANYSIEMQVSSHTVQSPTNNSQTRNQDLVVRIGATGSDRLKQRLIFNQDRQNGFETTTNLQRKIISSQVTSPVSNLGSIRR